MNHDYSKRGFLLPQGCKDLIDVISFQKPEGCKVLIDVPAPSKARALMQKIIGALTIREPISVRELAALLGQHPSRVIVDLLHVGVYSSLETEIGFGAASKVARKYGYKTKHLA